MSGASTATRLRGLPGLPTGLAGARRQALTWAFTFFNSVRVLAYLPTTWAIFSSGDSSQHSLWTWCTWLGANASMAAWLHEHNGHRIDKAVVVSMANALMCLINLIVILAYRL
jgi:hypothetical protein